MRVSSRLRDGSTDGEVAACLTEDQVVALLAGTLREAALSAAERHLDACRACRLLVSTLAAKTGDRQAPLAVSAFDPGDLVGGRYQVLALIGAGGMGEVYE